MFVLVLVLMATVLGVGTALVLGKMQISPNREKQAAFAAFTASFALGLLTFLLPRAEPPEWLKGWGKRTAKATT